MTANCGFTIANTCGERYFTTGVYYEGVLPNFSTLVVADCYTLEEIVADVYLLLEGINDQIEVDTILGDSCLSSTLEGGVITVRQALKTLETEVCDLKDKFDNIAKYQLCDLPIAGCELDLGSLVTDCEGEITNFGELFQALILGGAGSGQVIQNFDLYNSSGGSLTVTIAQAGENDQVIPINTLQTIVVPINISKEVTVTISGGITPQAEVEDTRYTSSTFINDIAFDFTVSFVAVLLAGVNTNPRIQVVDVA